MAQQIKKKFIGDDQVDGSKIKLETGEALRGTNLSGGTIEIIKAVNGKAIVLGQEVALKSQVDAALVEAKEYSDVKETEVKAYSDASVLVETNRAQAEEEKMLLLDGSRAMTGILNMGGKHIGFLPPPTVSGHASTKGYVDGTKALLDASIVAETSRATAAEGVLTSAVETEKGRIDAILLASNADKDSFAEIVELINSVDAENDSAFAGYVVSNNAALAQEVTDRQAADAALSLEVDAVEASLADKEDKANKSIDIELGSSDELYPSQKAVKTYVDAQDTKAMDAVLSGVNVEAFLPTPNSIETQVRHYSGGVALEASKRYAAYFTDTQMIFVDAVNPFTAEIIQTFTIPTGGSNFPQAATSIGNYVYMVTGGGRLYCFDWTDKVNPVNLGYVTIGTGQHFDVTTDGLNTLFIANTSNKRVYVVDITNRAAATLTKSLILGAGATDFGTGVAHSNGYLYVSNYNSKLHVMKKDTSTGEWLEILNLATIVNPCRTAVFTNSKGQKLLFAQRYNGVDAVVLDLANPELPVELKRVQAPASIQLYNIPFMFKDMVHIGLDDGRIGSVNIFDKNYIKYGETFEPKNANGTKKFSSMRGLVRMETSSPFFKEKTFLLATGVISGAATTQKVTTVIDLPMFNYINSSAVTTDVDLSSIQSELALLDSRLDSILLAADADKDSFAEIVQLINSVDTENDTAFAGYVLSNDAALAQEISSREAGDTSTLQAAKDYTDVKISEIPEVDLTSVESSIASLEASDVAIDGRLDVLEAKGYSKGSVTIAEELAFIDLDREYSVILFMSVGRLAVHEGEDFTTSIVDGKTRVTWIGSLVSPDGTEAIIAGDKIFWSGAY